MSRAIPVLLLFAAGCAAASPSPEMRQAQPASPFEGTWEYVGRLKGQAIVRNGQYVFLYGPSDGSGSMTGDAGTYRIVRDTATGQNTYSTDPRRVGQTYRWTIESWSGDTATYVVVNDAGQPTGRGRAVRRQ